MRFRFNFRIGTKLALSAGVGVVFVAAMIGNQRVVDSATREMAAQVNAAETTQKAILTAERELRRIIMQRDIRAAYGVKNIDRSLDRVATFSTEGLKSFEAAERSVRVPQAKQQIEKAKDLFTRYGTAVREAAAGQRQYIEARTGQSDKA